MLVAGEQPNKRGVTDSSCFDCWSPSGLFIRGSSDDIDDGGLFYFKTGPAYAGGNFVPNQACLALCTCHLNDRICSRSFYRVHPLPLGSSRSCNASTEPTTTRRNPGHATPGGETHKRAAQISDEIKAPGWSRSTETVYAPKISTHNLSRMRLKSSDLPPVAQPPSTTPLVQSLPPVPSKPPSAWPRPPSGCYYRLVQTRGWNASVGVCVQS